MSKILVAYFSATGTTGVAATKLAKSIGADIYEIVPEIPYTNADLDWKDAKSRSSIEMKQNISGRPAIGSPVIEDIGQYENVFLCYPIWWYRNPTIINTFVESYDFTGKQIVLFATSGSSGFGSSVEALEESAPGAHIKEGVMLNDFKSEEELKEIVMSLI